MFKLIAKWLKKSKKDSSVKSDILTAKYIDQVFSTINTVTGVITLFKGYICVYEPKTRNIAAQIICHRTSPQILIRYWEPPGSTIVKMEVFIESEEAYFLIKSNSSLQDSLDFINKALIKTDEKTLIKMMGKIKI